jgi:hypothetical protein
MVRREMPRQRTAFVARLRRTVDGVIAENMGDERESNTIMPVAKLLSFHTLLSIAKGLW